MGFIIVWPLLIALILQFFFGPVSRFVLAVTSVVVAVGMGAVAAAFASEGIDAGSDCAAWSTGTIQAVYGLAALAFAVSAGLAAYLAYSAVRGRSPAPPLLWEIGTVGVGVLCWGGLAGGTSC